MSKEAMKLALEAYLCREMPAGTIIGDPKWWASKIATAISEALAEQPRAVGTLARKPLTNEQVIKTFNAICNGKPFNVERILELHRAIEAAHGITGSKT